MNTKKLIGIALLVAGGVLLFFGYNASQATADQLVEAVTGRYSDETMMYLAGGGMAALIGLVLLFKK